MTDELKALSDAPCRVYVFAREDDGQIHGWEWREDIEDVDEVPSYIREDIHATAIEAARAEERKACEERVNLEYLEDPQTEEDMAYDRAVSECLAAIRTGVTHD